MTTVTCPHCYTSSTLEERTEDACARELFGMAPGMGSAWAQLVAYLGLFKPRSQALRWSRALMLAQQVAGLTNDQQALALALMETVEAMREKRQSPNWKPLTGHNYLKKVLVTAVERGTLAPISAAPQQRMQPQSKTAQTVELLRSYPAQRDIPEWFTRAICDAFADLLTMALDSVPPSDTMPIVIGRWHKELWPKRKWAEHCRFRGAKPLRNAIVKTAEHCKRWPQAGDVLSQIAEV